MGDATFLDLYRSDLQSVWVPCAVSAAFLVYLASTSRRPAGAGDLDPATRFVRTYLLLFAIETILDPLATGPLTRWLGASDSPLGTAILLVFVLLGDFRVFLLVFRLARPARPLATTLCEAGRWTLVVPIATLAVDGALRAAFPALPSQSVWLVYEVGFLGMALWLLTRRVPAWVPPGARRRALAAIAAYVAVYYALWTAADVWILLFGLDIGWALRIVPNQLYYSFYLPFVYFQLASRAYASSSASTQTSR